MALWPQGAYYQGLWRGDGTFKGMYIQLEKGSLWPSGYMVPIKVYGGGQPIALLPQGCLSSYMQRSLQPQGAYQGLWRGAYSHRVPIKVYGGGSLWPWVSYQGLWRGDGASKGMHIQLGKGSLWSSGHKLKKGSLWPSGHRVPIKVYGGMMELLKGCTSSFKHA